MVKQSYVLTACPESEGTATSKRRELRIEQHISDDLKIFIVTYV